MSQMEDQPLPSENHSRTSEAQQLLDRWSKSHIFDPYAAPKSPAEEVAATTPDPTSPSQQQPQPAASNLPNPANSMPAPANEPSSGRSDIASSNESAARPQATIASAAALQTPCPIAEPQIPTPSGDGQIANPASVQAPTNSAAPSDSAAALESLLVSNGLQPVEPKPPTPQPPTASQLGSLNATSDELDRLTHDIMSRVAQITESKQQPQADPLDSGTDLTAMTSPSADQRPETDNTNRAEETRHRPSSRLDPRPERENVSTKQWRVDSQEGQSTPLKSPAPKPHTPIPRTVAAEDLEVEHRELKSSVAKLREEQEQQPKKGGNWFGGLGQALAYMGILGLTAGTSLVILGYFGGPAQYAPTGWLITTVGQMLLFLGVVTLVSAGMEQTTVEVKQTVDESLKELTAKLDDMGDRIIRIEHKGHAPGPREPHFNSRVRTRETEHIDR